MMNNISNYNKNVDNIVGYGGSLAETIKVNNRFCVYLVHS